jgi:acetyl-CoA acetyltransferase family protein
VTEAVIVSAVRTAVGTARKGTLTETPAEILATHILQAAVERSGLPGERLDDVIMAESLYGGGDLARYAAVATGLQRVPGVAVNRHCAGSLTSTSFAAAQIIAGAADAIVAGGANSSSMSPILNWRVPGTESEYERRSVPTFPYTDGADDDTTISTGYNVALRHGLSREQMDAWALRSHQRAVAAIDAGWFEAEIAPIKVTRKDGAVVDFAVDEHPRRDTSMERLAKLKPVHPEIEGFSITAGNASGANDAASALLLTSDTLAAAEGLTPLATVTAWTSTGVDPAFTGLGAIAVIEKLFARTGLSRDDVDLWEINEAFAAVPVAACQVLGLDEEKVNAFGSGCSIGHPIAASGGRMLTTLVHALRRRGGGVGVAAMCAGGGQGGAVVVKVA